MDNKKKLIIIIAIFVVFMCGAAFLYNKLGKNVDRQQLATQNENMEHNEVTESTDSSNTETNTTETDTTVADTNDTDNTATDTQQEDTSEDKMLAPDFTVYDIDGNEVHLSDFVGKPIVLNFWASWCGPCKSEMPEFEEKYKEQNADVQFLMVNMTDGGRETVEIASEFIADQGYTFPVFYDTKSNASYLYSVYSLPTTYFIDKEGYMVAYAAGAIDASTLQKGIDMILEN